MLRCGARACAATVHKCGAVSAVVLWQQQLLLVRVCSATTTLHCARRGLCATTTVLHSGSDMAATPLAGVTATTTTTPLPGSDASSGGGGGSDGESALDVAMRVNKLKKMHQTGGSPSSKRQFEHDAWVALNALSEEQINGANGKAVSLLLNTWAYFAKFWERGKDGPADASTPPS